MDNVQGACPRGGGEISYRQRMKKIFSLLGLGLAAVLGFAEVEHGAAEEWNEASDSTVFLRDGWQIQAAAVVTDDGKTISSGTFTPNNWYSTSVPATVLEVALVESKMVILK